MLSSVSGLGRLFNAASSSLSPHTPRGQRQLESVTEEAHTYDLLYPEPGSLLTNQRLTLNFRHGDPSSIVAAANSSDDRGGLNVQHPRDLRILIGQYIGGNSRVLYDSQPSLIPPTPPTSPTFQRGVGESLEQARGLPRHGGISKSRTAPHSRQSSFSQVAQSMFAPPSSPLSPVNELGSLFGASRRPTTSDGENAQAMQANEEAKELDSLLLSMFGATGLRAESGTKIHIKPYTPNESEAVRPPSAGTPRIGSQTRRTPLTRSTTTEDLQSLSKSDSPGSTAHQLLRRKTSSILITRIFYVDPAEENTKGATTSGYSGSNQTGAHSTSSTHLKDPQPVSPDDKANQIRTPAFAIAMVLYVSTPPHLMRKTMSARASPALGHPLGQHDPSQAMQQASREFFDHSVEYVMAHWTMINRALSTLEVVVRCQLCNQLARMDINIPPPTSVAPQPDTKAGSRNVRMRPPPRPTLQLATGALQSDTVVQKAVDITNKRVSACLQIRLVAIGQDRWGVWREEARSVAKYLGGRESDLFFSNLLTAFLAFHTGWLNLMGPKVLREAHMKNRRRQSHQQSESICHRTVIISLDKMAARRLIYLLSTFLPSTYPDRIWRDGLKLETTSSVPTSSTSPSYSGSIPRRQSLRRTLQKTQSLSKGHQIKDNESAIADFDSGTELSDDRTIIEGPSVHQHSRRPSDVRSIRSVALPIASTGRVGQNSSPATTATIKSEFTMTVPYFSTYGAEPSLSSSLDWRPSSSGSVASLSLQRTLSRSESNEQSGTSVDSHSSGRWFWGSRRGSSADTSETPISSGEALGIYGLPTDTRDPRPVKKLTHLVENVGITSGSQKTLRPNDDDKFDATNLQRKPLAAQASSSPPREDSQPTETDELFPIDLSVNEEDGVIDVKLPPIDSQSSSFGSIISSPRGNRQFLNSFKDRSGMESHTSTTSVTKSRHETVPEAFVGGWLRRFHADLSLQAVQPYDTLKEEIKQAMRAERNSATPVVENQGFDGDGWQDVSTSLVADASTFTITRITLRRRNAASPHHQADALLGVETGDNLDEQFHEEYLSSGDPTLAEALESVLSRSGNSSHAVSRAPSRPSTPPRSSYRLGEPTPTGPGISSNECRNTIFGALEQITKSVLIENMQETSKDNSGTDGRSSAKVGLKSDEHLPSVPESLLKEEVRHWFNSNMD